MAHLWILWPALLALIAGAELSLWLGGNVKPVGTPQSARIRPVLYTGILVACAVAMLLPLGAEIGWLVACLVLVPIVAALLQFRMWRSDAK